MDKWRVRASDIKPMIEEELQKKGDFSDVEIGVAYIQEVDVDGRNWDLNEWCGPEDKVAHAKEVLGPWLEELRLKTEATD